MNADKYTAQKEEIERTWSWIDAVWNAEERNKVFVVTA